VDPQDLHDVVKAALLKIQFPIGPKPDPLAKHLKTTLTVRAALIWPHRHLRGQDRG
jgi:hypothetical protein